MADSTITLNPGSGGDVLDAETVGSTKRERMQVAGALLAEVARVTNAAPTTEYGLVTRNIPSGTQTVAGTVTANLGTIGSAATEASLQGILTALGTLLAELQQKYEGGAIALDAPTLAALESITVVGALTDTELRATPVPVSDGAGSLTVDGSVSVSNMIPAVETGLAKDGTDGSSPPAVLGSGTGIRGWLRSIYEKLTGSVAVTGTFWQATQPTSSSDGAQVTLGTTTDAEATGNGSVVAILKRIRTIVGGRLTVRSGPTGTSAVTSVAGSASSVTLIASNANRYLATIYNDSTATLYVKLGATASTTSYTVQVPANGYYEVPGAYTGVVDGIWSSATGNARCTELTP